MPKTILQIAICAALAAAGVFGQVKPAGEFDVAKCWTFPIGDEPGRAIATDGTLVYLGTGGAKVAALSLTGKQLWSTELGGEISSNILTSDNGLELVTTTATGTGGSLLRSLSKETGITIWAVKLPDAERHFLGSNDGSIIAVSGSGTVQAIDAKDGAVRWKRDIAKGFTGEPAFANGHVYVASAGKQIFGISLVSGEIDSMHKTAFGVTALGQSTDGDVIVGDERGNVISLHNGNDKPNWKFKSGGEISSIRGLDGHLLVTSHDNFVYYLSNERGNVVWKKRRSARVLQLGTVLDQYAVISSFEEHGAVLADLEKGKVAGRIVFADDESLAAGPATSGGGIFVLTNAAAYGYSISGCK